MPDTPLQSRLLIFTFEHFKAPEGGMPGNIADLQACFGKLMSACIGDLSSLLVPDEKSALDQASDSDGTESKQGGAFGMRMPREAGLDVQKFLFLALGGEGAINRNMTAYASVLWMMLILERSMGHEKEVRSWC